MSEDFLNFLGIFVLFGLFIASYFILTGLFGLNDYLSSLIDYDEKKYKRISLIAALIESITEFSINTLIYNGGMIDYSVRIASTFASFIYFYTFVYTIFFKSLESFLQ
ncbi:MAG: hypothetical protein ACTSRG_07820 [Candidatus Helarchaeota archaeon]